jgi:hypothetical protein
MASVKRAAAAVAAILVREGVDYAQSKAVFKAARARAGLRAAPEHRGGVERLTVEEELRFLDQAYAQDGRTGLMLQDRVGVCGGLRGDHFRDGGLRPSFHLARLPPLRPAVARTPEILMLSYLPIVGYPGDLFAQPASAWASGHPHVEIRDILHQT